MSRVCLASVSSRVCLASVSSRVCLILPALFVSSRVCLILPALFVSSRICLILPALFVLSAVLSRVCLVCLILPASFVLSRVCLVSRLSHLACVVRLVSRLSHLACVVRFVSRLSHLTCVVRLVCRLVSRLSCMSHLTRVIRLVSPCSSCLALFVSSRVVRSGPRRSSPTLLVFCVCLVCPVVQSGPRCSIWCVLSRVCPQALRRARRYSKCLTCLGETEGRLKGSKLSRRLCPALLSGFARLCCLTSGENTRAIPLLFI